MATEFEEGRERARLNAKASDLYDTAEVIALRNLVAAAGPASNSLALLMNAIKAQPGSPVDEERIALNAAIAAAKEVLT